MNEITLEVVEEFKMRMKLGDDENDNLKSILENSVEDLLVKCGQFDIATSKRFKELVFERSRYVYNDALEYFDTNFIRQINSLGFESASTSSIVEGNGNATV